jgi:hypothetical protein
MECGRLQVRNAQKWYIDRTLSVASEADKGVVGMPDLQWGECRL